jgi:hypothetical protein
MAVEPWLRGTLGEIEPVRRAVLHALELAGEDTERWCAGLGEEEIFARPFELPSVAFQMRHIVRSLDRLLTYAEGSLLSVSQVFGRSFGRGWRLRRIGCGRLRLPALGRCAGWGAWGCRRRSRGC